MCTNNTHLKGRYFVSFAWYVIGKNLILAGTGHYVTHDTQLSSSMCLSVTVLLWSTQAPYTLTTSEERGGGILPRLPHP